MMDKGTEKILDLHRRRMDSLDGVVKSLDKNLSGITRLLEQFSHHEYRLDKNTEDISELDKRVDILESNEDKNDTVMKILNRILILGIPSMIAAVFVMAGMLWYGINNPQNKSITPEQLDTLMQKYTQEETREK